MHILHGKTALSILGLGQLLGVLKQQLPVIQNLDCQFVYFIHCHQSLRDDEINKLNTILQASDQRHKNLPVPPKQSLILTIPRLSTISPWSDKATDILHNCGMSNILRIEKGIIWDISSDNDQPLNKTETERIKHLLYDRMTETIIHDIKQAEALFNSVAPAPLQSIKLLTQGKTALEQANKEMGLALSAQEISYLMQTFTTIGRDPTDAELMMFAQINSEHCRHKIFNSEWTINKQKSRVSLFAMIRQTHQQNPGKVLSAYSDNSAVTTGYTAHRFFATPESHHYQASEENIHILMKVETHNHPTAIAPHAGAATGVGGEIRDESATGRGAKPKAGLTGFAVSNLHIASFKQPWETTDYSKPGSIASALDIMLQAPIGGASFNNEFGRPNLAGYFRTYEQQDCHSGIIYGYHKPIMLAGGYGTIRASHVTKKHIPSGAKIIVLGGPAMRIGLGGGAASSMATGESEAKLDFASVQRENPEMQRRCQEIIDACWALQADNPIISIHDVGAGGLANALTELLHDNQLGAEFELREIPNADLSMSPMAIWCNESQERYVLAIAPANIATFSHFCKRERAPFSIIGETTKRQQLILNDQLLQNKTVDLPLSVLMGKLPAIQKDVQTQVHTYSRFDTTSITLEEAIHRVLHLPAVADKRFLITIGDRSVSGLVNRDQMVGPWQTPIGDCAVTASSFDAYTGEAMAIGERAPIALIDAPASGRMAVGEALTNMAAARILELNQVVFSANWMAACGHANEDVKLFNTVQAVSELCQALGICIPVGKDSLSMQVQWLEDDSHKQVISPLSLVISAFAPVIDIRKSLTPQLKNNCGETRLLLIDLGLGKDRLGGSCLTQVYQKISADTADLEKAHHLQVFFRAIQLLNEMDIILAYHDRADGGALVSLCEMAFSARTGIDICMDYAQAPLAALFNEELGAIIQVCTNDLHYVYEAFKGADIMQDHIHDIGTINQNQQLKISKNKQTLFTEDIYSLHRAWSETSFRMQSLRDNPVSAKQEYDTFLDKNDTGLFVDIPFTAAEKVHKPYINTHAKPRIAILREQGTNGHIEMAAAFHHAEFECTDIHMSDIINNRISLNVFQGLVACGGFSYGDVLDAGRGWANSILFNNIANDEFCSFFTRPDTFALGICNGCQMLAHLGSIIPGAEHWPTFAHNTSEQFEARLVMLEILDSPSIFLADMQGAKLAIVVAHREGRVVHRNEETKNHVSVTSRYIDYAGQVTETYPYNPNGSSNGESGFTSDDGRFTIMMPHPERCFLKKQYSWLPETWTTENGPWMRFFYNARKWIA